MNIEPTNEETIVSYIVKLNSATVTEVTEVPEVTDEIQVTPTSPSDAKHTETRPLYEEQERKLADDDVSLCCFVREALGDQGEVAKRYCTEEPDEEIANAWNFESIVDHCEKMVFESKNNEIEKSNSGNDSSSDKKTDEIDVDDVEDGGGDGEVDEEVAEEDDEVAEEYNHWIHKGGSWETQYSWNNGMTATGTETATTETNEDEDEKIPDCEETTEVEEENLDEENNIQSQTEAEVEDPGEEYIDWSYGYTRDAWKSLVPATEEDKEKVRNTEDQITEKTQDDETLTEDETKENVDEDEEEGMELVKWSYSYNHNKHETCDSEIGDNEVEKKESNKIESESEGKENDENCKSSASDKEKADGSEDDCTYNSLIGRPWNSSRERTKEKEQEQEELKEEDVKEEQGQVQTATKDSQGKTEESKTEDEDKLESEDHDIMSWSFGYSSQSWPDYSKNSTAEEEEVSENSETESDIDQNEAEELTVHDDDDDEEDDINPWRTGFTAEDLAELREEVEDIETNEEIGGEEENKSRLEVADDDDAYYEASISDASELNDSLDRIRNYDKERKIAAHRSRRTTENSLTEDEEGPPSPKIYVEHDLEILTLLVQDQLQSTYISQLSVIEGPVPWINFTVPMSLYIGTLQIVQNFKRELELDTDDCPKAQPILDAKPRSLNIEKLFDSNTIWTHVAIEADSGAGKTTLCRKIAHEWADVTLARGTADFVMDQQEALENPDGQKTKTKGKKPCERDPSRLWEYDFVFLLEGRCVAAYDSVLDAIWEVYFPDGYIYSSGSMTSSMASENLCFISKDQLKECLQKNEESTLIIIDGYNEIPETCNFRESLLKSIEWKGWDGVFLSKADWILTGHLRSTRPLWYYMSNLYVLIGNHTDEIRSLTKSYFKNIAKNSSQADIVIDGIENDMLLVDFAGNPLNLHLMCLLFEELDLQEFPQSKTELFQLIASVMLSRYVESDFVVKNVRLETNIQVAMGKIRELAFDGVLDERYYFNVEQLRHNNLDVPLVTQLGFLNENTPVGNNPWAKSTYSFSHKMYQEFLAAQYFIEQDKEFQIKVFPELAMNDRVNLTCVFISGLSESDEVLQKRIFQCLSQLSCMRYSPADPAYVKDKDYNVNKVNSIDIVQTQGTLKDVQLSFECFSEAGYNLSVVTPLAISMPDILVISHLRTTALSLKVLVRLLTRPRLKSKTFVIQMDGMHLKRVHALLLAKFIGKSIAVQRLVLVSHFLLDAQFFIDFLLLAFNKNQTLEHVTLVGQMNRAPNLERRQFRMIRACFLKPLTLDSLCLDSFSSGHRLAYVLKTWPALFRKIKLRLCNLESLAAIMLEEHVHKVTKTFEKLHLSSCFLPAQSAIPLFETLEMCPNLLTVQLDKVVSYRIYALKSDADMASIATRARMCQRNSVTTEITSSIGRLLMRCEWLHTVIITNCDVDDEAAETLFDFMDDMKAPLKLLDLSSNRIADSAISVLAQHLPKIHTLEHLDVSDNAIYNEGALALAEGMLYNTSVRVCKVNANQFSTVTAEKMILKLALRIKPKKLRFCVGLNEYDDLLSLPGMVNLTERLILT